MNDRAATSGLHAPTGDRASLVAAIVVYSTLAAAGSAALAVAFLELTESFGFGR